jgi:hypothetical protein
MAIARTALLDAPVEVIPNNGDLVKVMAEVGVLS